MARPRVPLIDRDTAIATALDLIDRDGLESFSTRRLAAELGVNAASLYHHFRNKDAILEGIRIRIALQSDLAAPDPPETTWEDHLRRATSAYRELLLLHPNMAPLMTPSSFTLPLGFAMREESAAKLLAGGVPPDLVYPVLDSTEMLGYSSAMLNPEQLPARKRTALPSDDTAPAYAEAIRSAPDTAREVFQTQLDALIAGWSELVHGRSASRPLSLEATT